MSVLELKSEIFKLPSLGENVDKTKLINGDSVKIRPILAGDQRYLAASRDQYQSYYNFLDRIIVEPKGLDLNSFLLDDVNALVFAVRILSYGPDYAVPFICTECNRTSFDEVDLNTVLVTQADEIPEGFKSTDIETKVGEHTVTFHLHTLTDEKNVFSQLDAFRRNKKIQDEVLDRIFITLAMKIDTINGNKAGFVEKFKFIENLTQAQFNQFVKTINAFTIGINDTVPVACKECGAAQEARLVITPEFFRPAGVDG